ncbi:MAG: trypsin-like peptidase domain-containing protein [Opitutales bacterium]|nr:trypsin-like peptidase domain-containing protein [Opitutales bacterium]MDG1324163.1 trypsin-like peptidase domain-containing protein [Opitutales bacterium]
MRKILFFLPSLFIFTSFCAAEYIQVELQNGSSISGELIKENADYWIIDLGFDLIKIPERECLKVTRNLSEENQQVSGTEANLYQQSPRASVLPLGTLVERLGESVVMIRTPVGLGSGFIVHPDGYVVTNDHVVAGERIISITQFRKGKNELIKENYDNVRIVATGGNIDLALLKIEGQSGRKTFPTVPLGNSNDLKQGERVFAIGSPLGLERSVSEGIVSLRNRIIQSRLHVQTTAEISPGNSGGPLFNYRGQVVGVNNMKVVSSGAEGLGFSIPVRQLKTFLENRDAFAFDPRNPNAGYRYVSPPQ